MTTNESASQPRLSADLEMLHARVKGKSLTLAELKQSLKGRGAELESTKHFLWHGNTFQALQRLEGSLSIWSFPRFPRH
jgi:hypothetical protein